VHSGYAIRCSRKRISGDSDLTQNRDSRVVALIVYTNVYRSQEAIMGVRIGIRELRDKLASYMESTVPIELTRHGQTVGFYIPVPKRPGQAEREALLEAGRRMQAELARLGVTEEELVADFKRWRKARRAK
jgi:antitoxin (DNA-binding transcriptional repressor) of toxin-antitoxin stability system